MTRWWPVPFALALTALSLYALFFAVLAVDIAVRVYASRAGFDDARVVGLLIGLEAVRAGVVAGAVLLAWRTAARPGPGRRALAAAVLFLAVWYAKAFGYAPFPGWLQERIAVVLNTRGVPSGVRLFLFAQPAWALWPALAGLLRFAAVHAGPLTPNAVHASGRADRRGAMRAVPLAGLDVGAAFRWVAARALERGLDRPVALAVLALAGVAAAGTGAGGAAGTVLQLAVGGAGLGVALTWLRAASAGAAAPGVLWLAEAGLVVVAALLAGGLLSAAPSEAAAWTSLVLLGVTPPAVLYCLFRSEATWPDAPPLVRAAGRLTRRGSVRPPAMRVP
jgi:hypothetical protein